MLSLFPRGVLDEILNLIESVSEDFPSYSPKRPQTSQGNREDSISTFILNAAAAELALILTKLYQLSLDTGDVPED